MYYVYIVITEKNVIRNMNLIKRYYICTYIVCHRLQKIYTTLKMYFSSFIKMKYASYKCLDITIRCLKCYNVLVLFFAAY